jgi:hypothetical protein
VDLVRLLTMKARTRARRKMSGRIPPKSEVIGPSSALAGEVDDPLIPIGALQLPTKSAVRLTREANVVILDRRLEVFGEPDELVALGTIVGTRTMRGRGAALCRGRDDGGAEA